MSVVNLVPLVGANDEERMRSALETLDSLRAAIVSGEIKAFCAVGIESRTCPFAIGRPVQSRRSIWKCSALYRGSWSASTRKSTTHNPADEPPSSH